MKSRLKYKMIVILGVLLFSCASAQHTDEVELSDYARKTGCANSENWFECVEDAFRVWEARENSEGDMTILSETKNGVHITRTVKVCWSDFCREFSYEYDNPTMWERIKSYSIVAALSLVTGAGIGATIAKLALIFL